MRPYVQDKGGYVEKMRRTTDRAIEYAMQGYKYFMAHSEFKKPYMATNYDDMEYGTDSPNDPTPTPRPVPRPLPGPEPPPGPGDPPIPSPGPKPRPLPGPVPGGPIYYGPYWCDIPDFFFCPGGQPVTVNVGGSDPVIRVDPPIGGDSTFQIGGKGGSIVVDPGTDSGFITVCATTQHGATCCGMGHAKDPAECENCGSPDIGYTTTGMDTGESQQLSITGGGGGPYTFSLLSGGGSVTPGGLYTAPASNANCSNNPIIALSCGGSVMATLALAVNAVAGGSVAYAGKTGCAYGRSEGMCFCSCSYDNYDCTGADLGYSPSTSCTEPPFSCPPEMAGDPCPGGGCPAAYDRRTSDQIAAGCCPAALL